MASILFDYQIFEKQSFGGISKMYCEIIPYLSKCYDCMISIKRSNNQHLIDSHLVKDLKPLKSVENTFLHKMHIPGKRTIEQLLFHNQDNYKYTVNLLTKQQFDIFEPTYYDPYFLEYIGSKKYMLEIHDMTPELFPKYFGKDDYQVTNKKLLSSRALHIHTPSNKTKEDIVNIYNIKPEHITVISRGVNPLPLSTGKSLFSFPYLLYVGSRFTYKNFTTLLHSFSQIAADNKDIRLVCTGANLSKDENILIHSLHLDGRIYHYVPTIKDFGDLYHNAVAFVFPSAYEGFGLPILEAYSCGCPVMLNNTSCFPEIAGDAAIYFNMNDKESDFYDKFKYMWEMSSSERQIIINKGYERVKLYSWDKTAQNLSAIYKKFI